jgi:hypothetical protein
MTLEPVLWSHIRTLQQSKYEDYLKNGSIYDVTRELEIACLVHNFTLIASIQQHQVGQITAIKDVKFQEHMCMLITRACLLLLDKKERARDVANSLEKIYELFSGISMDYRHIPIVWGIVLGAYAKNDITELHVERFYSILCSTYTQMQPTRRWILLRGFMDEHRHIKGQQSHAYQRLTEFVAPLGHNASNIPSVCILLEDVKAIRQPASEQAIMLNCIINACFEHVSRNSSLYPAHDQWLTMHYFRAWGYDNLAERVKNQQPIKINAPPGSPLQPTSPRCVDNDPRPIVPRSH